MKYGNKFLFVFIRERSWTSAFHFSPLRVLGALGGSTFRYSGRANAIEQQISLARVLRERRRAVEFGAGFVETFQLEEQIAANAGQQVIGRKRSVARQFVDDRQSRRRSGRHRHGHCAVQLDDGRWHDARKLRIQRRDARPVGFIGSPCTRVIRGDRRLQRVRPARAAEFFGTIEGG